MATSILRETKLQHAKRMHEHAQIMGDAESYELAAEAYEEARYYTVANNCRQAAQRLRLVEQAGQKA